MNSERLSRFMAYVLRHAAHEFGLEPDAEGFVPVDALVQVVGRDPRLQGAGRQEILAVAAEGRPRRFEVCGERIRAVYGHSRAGVPEIAYPPATPPDILYHGTHAAALPRIRAHGLRPMSRQYVHLSTNVERAREVGARRSVRPIVLSIRAREAAAAGVVFHAAEAQHWLASSVPREFIIFPATPSRR